MIKATFDLAQFREDLRQTLKDRGLTHKQLGQLLDIPGSTISMQLGPNVRTQDISVSALLPLLMWMHGDFYDYVTKDPA